MDTVSVLITDYVLGKNECCRCAVRCRPADPNLPSATLALIERQGDFALFLFSNLRQSVVESTDLKLDNILPVASDFACEEAGIHHDSLVDDIQVQISNERVTLDFLLPSGQQSKGFIKDVQRASDSARNMVTIGNPQWNWLEKHINRIENRTGLNVHRMSNGQDGGPIGVGDGDDVSLDTFMSTTSCPSTLTPDGDRLSTGSSLRGSPFPEETYSPSNFNSPAHRLSHETEENRSPSRVNGGFGGADLVDAPLGSCLGDNIIRRPGKTGKTDHRETYVNMNMLMREQDFTDLETFKIFIGTWNVNGQAASERLEPWLAMDPTPPDLYVVGFQELDLSKEAFLFSESEREAEWLAKVRKGLHPKAQYELVRVIRLVGMMLVVLVKDSHRKVVSEVVAETVGTGLMGKMGNKGGVAIRFKFHNSTFCFVDSHLAAHTGEVERRNQDFRDINQRMEFAFDPESLDRIMNIESHDVVFWMGDLNYRIFDANLSTEKIKQLVQEENFEYLYKFDQLNQSREAKKCFHDYHEGRIAFKPTYKYDPGTDEWDSSEKCRIPAWCDRVLWRTFGYYIRGTHRHAVLDDGENRTVVQTAYRSHPELKLSDHKPVSAAFDVQVKVVNNEKRKKIYEDLMKRMDKLENEFLPQVELDSLELDFSAVKFLEPKILQIGITNTGQIPVQYGFVNKPDDSHFCKPWLKIKNNCDIILPKEKALVDVSCEVTPATAALFNSGRDQLDDILVLHLENGKDIFVTVKGVYKPSCFGASVDALVRMTLPIGDYTMDQIKDLEKTSSAFDSVDGVCGNTTWLTQTNATFGQTYDIPKELWILVDHIHRYGKDQKHLFQSKAADPSSVRKIIETLDGEIPERLPVGDIHAVTESLLLFLESLPDSVIPFGYHERCLENSGNPAEAARIVQTLPLFHLNVFQYLMAFLNHLLRYSVSNGLEKDWLASVFGESILRSRGVGQGRKLMPKSQRTKKQTQFLLHFLEDDCSYA